VADDLTMSLWRDHARLHSPAQTQARLEEYSRVLKRSLAAEARVKELEAELDGLRSHHQWLAGERNRIMADNLRRHQQGKIRERWLIATNRRLDNDSSSTLHCRDATSPPHLAEPTTVRGRYINGRIREAGPGSYIGLALCGEPLLADHLWVTADHALKAAYRNPNSRYELCGMCSYLAGTPTIEAAWEACRAR
jgi:hypothetical protein